MGTLQFGHPRSIDEALLGLLSRFVETLIKPIRLAEQAGGHNGDRPFDVCASPLDRPIGGWAFRD